MIGLWLLTRHSHLWRFAVARLLIVGLLIGLFWGSYALGREQAKAYFAEQRNTDYADFPWVTVRFKETSQGQEGALDKRG